MATKEEELQNAENWDFENAEKMPGRKNARAVVSVAFNRDDFELVGQRAEQLGMKTSEFIREATLNFIQGTRGPQLDVTTASWSALPDDENSVVSVA